MLTTFVTDLIYTQDEKVKILEIGRALYAGFRGYDSLYPKRKMWEGKILPFYEKEIAKPVWSKGETSRALARQRLRHLKGFDDVADKHRAEPSADLSKPVSPFDTEALVYPVARITGETFLDIRRNYPKVGIVDPWFPLNAAFNNKAILASSEIGVRLGEAMPQQAVYPKMPYEIIAPRILEDFPDSPFLVLKSPSASQGKRVAIVRRGDLEDPAAFQHLFDHGKSGKSKESGVSTLSNIFKCYALGRRDHIDQFSPNFVVQGHVEAKKIKVGRKHYTPTMRVVMSAWQDDEGRVEMAFHGAYWKLPSAPAGANIDPVNAISHVKKSDIRKGRAVSTKVDHDTYVAVTKQLEDAFKPALHAAMTMTPTEVVSGMLSSKREGDVLSGVRMALMNNGFFHAGERYPEELKEKLLDAARANPLLRQYMLAMRRTEDIPADMRRDVLSCLDEHKAADHARKHLMAQRARSRYGSLRMVET